jgi:hypothetical protein
MLKRIAIAWGVVFLLIGVLGFVPALAPTGPSGHPELFRLFAVDAPHNVVHLLTGLIALGVGFTSESASQMYFRIFGIVYAIVAVIGFFVGRGELLGLMANNMGDAFLHVAIAVISLYLGFGSVGLIRHADEPSRSVP